MTRKKDKPTQIQNANAGTQSNTESDEENALAGNRFTEKERMVMFGES